METWYSRSSKVGGRGSRAAHPVGEREALGHQPAAAPPHAQHRGVQHATRPVRGRIVGVRDRRAARCARDRPASTPPSAWTSSRCAARAGAASSRTPPSSTGPSACTAAQRAATAAALPRVDADLDGGRRAHGAAPVRADAVERLLHRAVARELQQALRRAVAAPRPGSSTARPAAAARRCSAVGVGGGGGEQPGEIGSGGLASSIWPPGSTVTREPPGSGSAGDDGSRATGQCLPSAAASGRR